jgi:transglutaminase-like putative cysteine protease
MKAQNFSKEYSKIGLEEAELSYYAPDKTAEAVVLFDIGKSYFQDTGNSLKVIFEKTTRIKIFSEAGLKWAEIEVPYYHENQIFEEVYDIEACTYTPENGIFKITPLDLSTCHDEKLNDNWTVKKFALPDVKAGSIIQYKYKISSDYMFNFRDWEFQSRIPTVYSEYEVSMIPFYEYVWLFQGASKFDSQTTHTTTGLSRRYAGVDFQDVVYNYVLKNVPAFKEEEYITSINDYVIKIDFQLAKIHYPTGQTVQIISTWSELVKTLLKDADVAKFAARSEKLISKLFSADSLLNKSQSEKFEFILNYVKANFNWNKINSKYASKSPNDLLNDKFGNSADLNLLTIGLLNAAGIEAYPLIISTRDNGQIKVDYPYLKFFNYVLISATVDSKNILSDATEVFCQNDRIPTRCLNDRGLLIKEGNVQWISLKNNIPSEIQTIISIDSIGEKLYVSRSISATEYDALRYRNLYGDDKEKINDKLNEYSQTIDESSISVSNPLKKSEPYCIKYSSDCKTETVNNKIYLSPFVNEPITENPLKQYSRTYPIDLIYPVKRSYNSVITIPDGYKVEFVPENFKILNDQFELNYIVKNDGKTLTVTFDYSFKKPIYPASEYTNIKFYFKDIIKKGNEKIVLIHA